jgi:hypothetical protein
MDALLRILPWAGRLDGLNSRYCTPTGGRGVARLVNRLLWRSYQSLPYCLLARELAGAPHRLCLFTGAPLRRLLKKPTSFHLAKDTFTLHFLFQDAESLIHVVVANEHLQCCILPNLSSGHSRRIAEDRSLASNVPTWRFISLSVSVHNISSLSNFDLARRRPVSYVKISSFRPDDLATQRSARLTNDLLPKSRT